MGSKKYNKKRRLRAIELNLCRNCGCKKERDDLKECAKCKESKKKWKERNKLMRRCVACGRPLFDDTHLSCMLCRRSAKERTLENGKWR